MKSRIVRTARMLLVPAALLALGPVPARASERWSDYSRLASPEARAEAAAFEARLEGAATVEEARALAEAELRFAGRALGVAEAALPASDSFARARAKLAALEARVGEAETAAEVAGAMGFLVQPAAYGPPVYAAGGGDCNYSSTDTIVIVIGLIFGIIPGLIYLWLLC